MSTTTKKSVKKKLILILAAAIAIMAIIPLSSRGSEGGSATVKFKIDNQLYGQEMKVPVGDTESDLTISKENEELGITEFFLVTSQFPQDPEKDGYTFIGWSDGNKIYTGDGTNLLKVSIGDDITLNAVFEENEADGSEGSDKKKQASEDKPVLKEGDLVLDISGLNSTKNDTLTKKIAAALTEEGYETASEGYGDIKGLVLDGSMLTADFNFIKNNLKGTLEFLDITKISNTSIPSRGLESLTALKQVKLSDEITNLESRAFWGCTSLKNIDLSKIEIIGSTALQDCVGLTGSYSLKSLKSIDTGAFKGCTGITAITDFDLNDVTVIENQTFQNCTSLKSIDLSNITTINGTNSAHGYGAFLGCTALTDVGNTEKLTYVGACAFKGCTALEKINLSNVEKLDSGGWETGAFKDCSALVDVGNTEKLIYVGAGSFRSNVSLKEVNISNVKTIGLDAFRDCQSLESVVGDMSSVESIGSAAFYNCVKLTGPYDLKNLKNLDHTAFKNCSSLTSIENFELNEVEVIGEQTFMNCTVLKSIDLSNVSAIDGNGKSTGYGAFANCTALTDLGNTKKLSNIGASAFKSCKALTEIDLSGAEMIDIDAFYNCTLLEKVTFPTKASYGTNGFYGCALDMSSSNPSGGYPEGTYPSDKPVNTFSNQHPRAFFSLSTTSATIEVNGTYPDPAQVKTMYGHDYKDIVGAEWMNSGIKVAVKASPDPVASAKKVGKYDIKYTTAYSKMQLDNGVNELVFKLTVIDVPPVLTPEDGTRDSAVKGAADFSSDKAGEYYYLVLDKDAGKPEASDILKGTKATLLEGKNQIEISDLKDSKDKIVYTIAKSGDSKWSNIISIDIPEWKWQLDLDVIDKIGGTVSLNGGTFTGNSVSGTFSAGSNASLGAKPDTGYVFVGWFEAGGDALKALKNLQERFTIPDNDTKVSAKFEKLIVTGGFVYKDKNGNGQYDEGTDKKYNDEDNMVVQLFPYEDGELATEAAMTADVESDGSYKFEGVAAGKYRVKALAASPYKSAYSDVFNVKSNEHLNMDANLAVQAEASLNVEFYDGNNNKIGNSVELFGANKDRLKDLTKNVKVKAVSADKATADNEVAVPDHQSYIIVGSDTKSAEYDWDDPETFDKTIKFELQAKAVETGTSSENNGQLASPEEALPAGDSTGSVAQNNEASVKAKESNILGSSDIPTLGFGDNKTPLYGKDSWALVNLILAIGGLVVAAMVSAVVFMRRNRKNEMENGEEDDVVSRHGKTVLIGFAGTIILALCGVILFMITENMDLSMVLVNKWTIFNAIIFGGEIVLSLFAIRNRKEDFQGNVRV